MKAEAAPIGIVIGASGGIGRALVNVMRTRNDLSAVVELSRCNGDLDLQNEASIAAAAKAVSADHGATSVRIIFNATGILDATGNGPEKSFSTLTSEGMLSAFSVNTFGAALVFKHFMPLLVQNGPAYFGVLSARVGSIGDNRLGGWMSYRASKAALNQIVRCAAIEQARRNAQSIIAALHPGTIETKLTKKFARGRYTATTEEAATSLIDVLTHLAPEQSGEFYGYDGRKIVW